MTKLKNSLINLEESLNIKDIVSNIQGLYTVNNPYVTLHLTEGECYTHDKFMYEVSESKIVEPYLQCMNVNFTLDHESESEGLHGYILEHIKQEINLSIKKLKKAASLLGCNSEFLYFPFCYKIMIQENHLVFAKNIIFTYYIGAYGGLY